MKEANTWHQLYLRLALIKAHRQVQQVAVQSLDTPDFHGHRTMYATPGTLKKYRVLVKYYQCPEHCIVAMGGDVAELLAGIEAYWSHLRVNGFKPPEDDVSWL